MKRTISQVEDNVASTTTDTVTTNTTVVDTKPWQYVMTEATHDWNEEYCINTGFQCLIKDDPSWVKREFRTDALAFPPTNKGQRDYTIVRDLLLLWQRWADDGLFDKDILSDKLAKLAFDQSPVEIENYFISPARLTTWYTAMRKLASIRYGNCNSNGFSPFKFCDDEYLIVYVRLNTIREVMPNALRPGLSWSELIDQNEIQWKLLSRDDVDFDDTKGCYGGSFRDIEAIFDEILKYASYRYDTLDTYSTSGYFNNTNKRCKLEEILNKPRFFSTPVPFTEIPVYARVSFRRKARLD